MRCLGINRKAGDEIGGGEYAGGGGRGGGETEGEGIINDRTAWGCIRPRMSDIRAAVKKSHLISEVATTAPSQALTSYLGSFGGKIDFFFLLANYLDLFSRLFCQFLLDNGERQ